MIIIATNGSERWKANRYISFHLVALAFGALFNMLFYLSVNRVHRCPICIEWQWRPCIASERKSKPKRNHKIHELNGTDEQFVHTIHCNRPKSRVRYHPFMSAALLFAKHSKPLHFFLLSRLSFTPAKIRRQTVFKLCVHTIDARFLIEIQNISNGFCKISRLFPFNCRACKKER